MKIKLDWRNSGSGKIGPTRTLAEFATEFGVLPGHLGKMLLAFNGPAGFKPSSARTVYYPVAEMRKWWAENKDKQVTYQGKKEKQ